jgi:hypothetical protein
MFAEFLYLRSPLAPEACCHPLQGESSIVWATSVLGHRLGWRLAEGGSWQVTVESRSIDVTPVPTGLTAFLLGWLEGTLAVPDFPENDRYFDPTFETDTKQSHVVVDLVFNADSFASRWDALLSAFKGARITRLVPNSDGHIKLPDGTRLVLAHRGSRGGYLKLRFGEEREAALRTEIKSLLARLGWSAWRVAWNKVPMWPEIPLLPQNPLPARPAIDLEAVSACLRKLIMMETTAARGAVFKRVRQQTNEAIQRARDNGWDGSAAALPEELREAYERQLARASGSTRG